ncbi:FKBP-type peptidyl-prolyl cis-trans isomerase [Streptomyces sp. BI20]|uniref:FKBP-type peptidyl-prolyl cis-trans isomerase n=1 Tax=Streptomyces sp. BI20 TaxID=3403460 RepID=UPI003C771FF9
MDRWRFKTGTAFAAAVMALTLAACTAPKAEKISVAGAFGEKPTVGISSPVTPPELDVKTVITGDGKPVESGDFISVEYAMYSLGDGREVGNSFAAAEFPLFFQAGDTGPGRPPEAFLKAVEGAAEGSRLQVSTPAESLYGDRGNKRFGVKPDEPVLLVLDVVKNYAKRVQVDGRLVERGDAGNPIVTAGASEPDVRIPEGAPPREYRSEVIVEGSGKPVGSMDQIQVHYAGYAWEAGKKFDSSWEFNHPLPVPMWEPVSQWTEGWSEGLIGKRVGSRVLLTIPPEKGYGKNPPRDCPEDATLVFVVDIFDSRPAPAAPAAAS